MKKTKQYCQEPGLNAFRQHQLISSHRVCHTIPILDGAGLEMRSLLPSDQRPQNLTKSTSSASQVTFQQSKPWLPGNISESIPHLNPQGMILDFFCLEGRPLIFLGWPWVGLHKSRHFVFRSIAVMFLCVVGPQVQCLFMRWGGGYFHPMWSKWPTQPVFEQKNLAEY